MVSKMRAQRIADRIREELSEILLYEVADPRLLGVSVTDVKVDRELTLANVYVSALEGSSRADDILNGLWHAQGFLRSELAHRIELRTFPRLEFHWDPTFERADRIEQLIATIQEERAMNEAAEIMTNGIEDEPQDKSQDDAGNAEENNASG